MIEVTVYKYKGGGLWVCHKVKKYKDIMKAKAYVDKLNSQPNYTAIMKGE